MYSFVVILASMVHIIRCASDVTDYVRNYGRKELFPGLFDRVELPHDDVLPMLNGKIFKGRRVSIREHPYVASIRRNVAHYLTGCILTKNIVITVAHPLNNVSVAELSVVVGENYSDRGSMMLTVILMIVHTNFNPSTLDNDIALLRTFEDITYKGSAKSIPLVRNTLSITGSKAFVTGWGRCDRTNEVFLPPSVLCLGVAREKNPMASCMAVPGAPLVVAANLVGVLSWGFGCGHTKDLPLIYISTEYYLPWLAHNISVLRRINKVYLLKLFQAKRAYILKQWLNLTRIVPPRPDKDNGKHMTILLVDSELAKLYGNVYDIRDFIFNGIHHKYKTKVYKKLRESFALEPIEKLKMEAIKESFKKRNDSLRPFMSEHSEESDFEPFMIATDEDKRDGVESHEEYEG